MTDEKRRNVLIIDDSIFSRSRSKKVELLAKVFDHAHGLYTFGFRMLTLGWSDGNTFLPVSHCLLSTANQKNRINEASTKVDPRTNGGRQRKLAQLKATDVVLKLLKETKAAGISAQHVLFDKCFCAPASLTAIKDIGFDVIAMAKKTSKMQDVKAIYQQNTKRRGRAKYLLSVEAGAVKDGKAFLSASSMCITAIGVKTIWYWLRPTCPLAKKKSSAYMGDAGALRFSSRSANLICISVRTAVRFSTTP
nr:transposase [Propionispira arboris]